MMNFLKSLAITVLTFILFLSLALFGTVFALNSTLLDPDFVAAEADKIPVSALVKEMTEEQFSEQLPEEAWFANETLYNVISEQEPRLKEEVRGGIYAFYDFLLGKSERLSMVISLDSLKEGLRESLWKVFQQNLGSLPPELAAAPPAVVEQYFDEFYRQFAGEIPSELRVDESSVPPEVMAQIILARQYVSYTRTAYYGLIGLMVLLVLAIIFLHRSVKGATRELGITFLIYGIIEYAGVWATRNFLPASLPLPDIPSALQPWLTGLIRDFVAPLEIFSIGLMAGGAALIIVSIVYRPRRVEEEAVKINE